MRENCGGQASECISKNAFIGFSDLTIGIRIVGRFTAREGSPRLQRNAACERAGKGHIQPGRKLHTRRSNPSRQEVAL